MYFIASGRLKVFRHTKEESKVQVCMFGCYGNSYVVTVHISCISDLTDCTVSVLWISP